MKIITSKIDEIRKRSEVIQLPDEVTAEISRELNEAMADFRREIARKLALSEQEAAKVILTEKAGALDAGRRDGRGVIHV